MVFLDTTIFNLYKSIIVLGYNNTSLVDSTNLEKQQDFFLKYEETYFLDKKCGDL